jgi:hypothetical protein
MAEMEKEQHCAAVRRFSAGHRFSGFKRLIRLRGVAASYLMAESEMETAQHWDAVRRFWAAVPYGARAHVFSFQRLIRLRGVTASYLMVFGTAQR